MKTVTEVANDVVKLAPASQLPAVKGTGTALAVLDPARLPKPVNDALVELLLAFPSRGHDPSDRPIMLGTYRDAVAGYPEETVIETLKWLRFNNIRNTATFTQPPTPQDVRNAIENRRPKSAKEMAAAWDRKMRERKA